MRIATSKGGSTMFYSSIPLEFVLVIIEPINCYICGEILDYRYNYIIGRLKDSGLLLDDHVSLCCLCDFILRPETKIKKIVKSKYYYHVETNIHDVGVQRDAVENCRKSDEEIKKKFYKKIISKL